MSLNFFLFLLIIILIIARLELFTEINRQLKNAKVSSFLGFFKHTLKDLKIALEKFSNWLILQNKILNFWIY